MLDRAAGIVAQLPQKLMNCACLSWNLTAAALLTPGAADGPAQNPRGML